MAIDEKFHGALLQALSRQRNEALDTSAQIEASLNVALGENAALKKQVDDLTNELDSATQANVQRLAELQTQLAYLSERVEVTPPQEPPADPPPQA